MIFCTYCQKLVEEPHRCEDQVAGTATYPVTARNLSTRHRKIANVEEYHDAGRRSLPRKAR